MKWTLQTGDGELYEGLDDAPQICAEDTRNIWLVAANEVLATGIELWLGEMA